MLYTINELRQKMFHSVYDVYEIFQNFFGEEYTDLQGMPDNDRILNSLYAWDVEESEYEHNYEVSDEQYANILHLYESTKPHIIVWWPKVTISNENNKSVEIQDLYAKVELTIDGQIPYENVGFQLTRATFSDVQFVSGYIHSHVPGRYYDELPKFQTPCLGTGPIKRTIADLKNNYEEPLWMLFCQELSLYVTVESLVGGPYRKLEEIGKAKIMSKYSKFENLYYSDLYRFYDVGNIQSKHQFDTIIKSFTDYYLSLNTLPFSYMDGKYCCGFSYYNYMIDISNAFISWFNQNGQQKFVDDLYRKDWVVKTFVRDGKFYENKTISRSEWERWEGYRLLTFKDQSVNLQIFQENSSEYQTTLLLNHMIAMYILQRILTIINYHYRNEHNNNREGTPESPSTTYQTVCYL